VAPIPPFVAAFIMRQIPREKWDAAIAGARATNPELASQLAQAATYLRDGSRWWRDRVMAVTSDSGSAEAQVAEAAADSERPDSLDTAAVGRRLGCSSRWVCQLIEGEHLRAHKVGRSWAVDPRSVEEYQMRLNDE
jgi:hypothetical protein